MSDEKKNVNVENVSGGNANGSYFHAVDGGKNHLLHEIIGDKGQVLASFDSKEDAMEFAKSKGLSTDELTLGELNARRAEGAKPPVAPPAMPQRPPMIMPRPGIGMPPIIAPQPMFTPAEIAKLRKLIADKN